MKLQPLYDLQQEINRLFVAGSKFAKDDPRLQKQIPVFNKLGEKAPVFKKLADDLNELLRADTQQSAEKLMAISTLLYSVLYTQGETTEQEVQENAQTPDIPLAAVNTEYSYLQLKPIMEALTAGKSGRLEILQNTDSRIFKDSRLYPYLSAALADKYGEFCDYLENAVIPAAGKPMISFLLQDFKYEDKTEQARRFRLLHRLGCTQIPEMINSIMSSSFPLLQAEAIAVLGEDISNENFIIQLAGDKKKQVRAAAYKALAKLNTEAALEKLKNIYVEDSSKTNLPDIVAALASTKLPFFFQEVFEQTVKSFQEFIALNKETDGKILAEQLDKFRQNVGVLENKDRTEVYEFFGRVLTDKTYNALISAKESILGSNAQNGVSTAIIGCLNTFDKLKTLSFYEKNMPLIPEANWKQPLWINYFHIAAQQYSKEQLFNAFSESFKRGTININQLYAVFTNGKEYFTFDSIQIYTDKIDKRWVKLWYEMLDDKQLKWKYNYKYALILLNACEPESKKMDELLVSLAKSTKPDAWDIILRDAWDIIFKLLMDRKIKNRFEIIYQAMAQYAGGVYYGYRYLKDLNIWNQFPKEYAAKYRALYAAKKLEIFNDIASAIEAQ